MVLLFTLAGVKVKSETRAETAPNTRGSSSKSGAIVASLRRHTKKLFSSCSRVQRSCVVHPLFTLIRGSQDGEGYSTGRLEQKRGDKRAQNNDRTISCPHDIGRWLQVAAKSVQGVRVHAYTMMNYLAVCAALSPY